MGYTWRWWPPLRKVRELLSEGAIGTIRHVQFHMSAHLADWHPVGALSGLLHGAPGTGRRGSAG